MDQLLTRAEIEERFASEWVLVDDPQVSESLEVQRGKVLYHKTFSEMPTPSGLSGVFGDSLSGYVVHRQLPWMHPTTPVSCSETHL